MRGLRPIRAACRFPRDPSLNYGDRAHEGLGNKSLIRSWFNLVHHVLQDGSDDCL
jgi:hypothetical protein